MRNMNELVTSSDLYNLAARLERNVVVSGGQDKSRRVEAEREALPALQAAARALSDLEYIALKEPRCEECPNFHEWCEFAGAIGDWDDIVTESECMCPDPEYCPRIIAEREEERLLHFPGAYPSGVY